MTPRPVLGALLITALTLLCLAWRLQVLRLARENWCPDQDVWDAQEEQERQDAHEGQDAHETQYAQDEHTVNDAQKTQNLQEAQEGKDAQVEKNVEQCKKVNNVVFLKTHKVSGIIVPFL